MRSGEEGLDGAKVSDSVDFLRLLRLGRNATPKSSDNEGKKPYQFSFWIARFLPIVGTRATNLTARFLCILFVPNRKLI